MADGIPNWFDYLFGLGKSLLYGLLLHARIVMLKGLGA
jgi:hypothetical protein